MAGPGPCEKQNGGVATLVSHAFEGGLPSDDLMSEAGGSMHSGTAPGSGFGTGAGCLQLQSRRQLANTCAQAMLAGDPHRPPRGQAAGPGIDSAASVGASDDTAFMGSPALIHGHAPAVQHEQCACTACQVGRHHVGRPAQYHPGSCQGQRLGESYQLSQQRQQQQHAHGHAQDYPASRGMSPSQFLEHSGMMRARVSYNEELWTLHMRAASNSTVPMERYYSLHWLIDTARAELAKGEAQGPIALPTPGSLLPSAWASQPHMQRVLRNVLDTGDAIARFCTAEFAGESGSNGARAIMTDDLRKLLAAYVGAFGYLLESSLWELLPRPDLKVDASALRSLLASRCSSLDLIYEQLIRRVGKEPGKGCAGPTTIINAPTMNSNPTNTVSASPVTLANAAAAAKSKLSQAGLSGPLLAAAAAALAVGVLGLRMRGGAARRSERTRRHGGAWGRAAPGHAAKSSRAGLRRSSSPTSHSGSLEMDLLAGHAACMQELRKAERNESLLRADWRLGGLRLAWPPSPDPPGYHALEPDACDLAKVLAAQMQLDLPRY